MSNKIAITITDYNAVSICATIGALIKESGNDPKLKKLLEANDEMFKEISTKLTPEQFDRIKIDFEINQILGIEP